MHKSWTGVGHPIEERQLLMKDINAAHSAIVITLTRDFEIRYNVLGEISYTEAVGCLEIAKAMMIQSDQDDGY